MSQPFDDPGGASFSNPNCLRRWATSLMFRRLADPRRRRRRRERFERRRARAGAPHQLEYFHQVEDPYSYLAAQLLPRLLAGYDIELLPHLVSGPVGAHAPEPDLLLPYARRDCEQIARYYGLEFSPAVAAPDAQAIAQARALLAAAPPGDFPQLSVAVGRALWSGERAPLALSVQRPAVADTAVGPAALARGNARRRALGHYAGAMFYYGTEWYWGVDRLYHLEHRLAQLGLRADPTGRPIAPRPAVDPGSPRDGNALTLEIYLSLRSPYSSIVFDRTVALAQHTGTRLLVRPVLPMVMRGAPVSLQKGRYIAFDTAREAETSGLQWGNACDPVGEPVRKALALYLWAERQGRGNHFISAFMRGVWFERVDANRRAGLRRIVEAAGLDWAEARHQLANTDWPRLLEANRQALYSQGIWGVPSFRLLTDDGRCLLSTWGQDRLWLVARKIQEYAAATPTAE